MATILACFSLVLAIGYLLGSLWIVISQAKKLTNLGVIMYSIQAIVAPALLLLLSGLLFFQGWRLDPLMLFAWFLVFLLLVFLLLKDGWIWTLPSQ
jgi:hypothetical protein